MEIHKNYHPLTMNILKEICPEKVKLYDYSDFTIVVTSKNTKFPIHDDTPNKLLSGVIYLTPEENSGTIFYSSKKGENKKEIEWKQNRAVFFSRKEKIIPLTLQFSHKLSQFCLVFKKTSNKYKLIN